MKNGPFHMRLKSDADDAGFRFALVLDFESNKSLGGGWEVVKHVISITQSSYIEMLVNRNVLAALSTLWKRLPEEIQTPLKYFIEEGAARAARRRPPVLPNWLVSSPELFPRGIFDYQLLALL